MQFLFAVKTCCYSPKKMGIQLEVQALTFLLICSANVNNSSFFLKKGKYQHTGEKQLEKSVIKVGKGK